MNNISTKAVIVTIELIIIAIIIVGIQRSDRKYPPQYDARTSDAFESVIDKFVSELTSEYEPSTATTEVSTEEKTTIEPTAERKTQSEQIETTTEYLVINTTISRDSHEIEVRAPIPGDYIGTFELTAYEWTGYPMANGEYPYYGACASNYFALGTVLYIEGYGTFTVCDRGGMANNVIDIYLGGAQECIEFGRRTAEVYYG